MKLCSDFISYEIDGEKILVCMDSSKFAGVVKLNGTANFIVEQLKKGCTEDELTAAVAAEFEQADPAQVKEDVASLIATLKSVGAVEE